MALSFELEIVTFTVRIFIITTSPTVFVVDEIWFVVISWFVVDEIWLVVISWFVVDEHMGRMFEFLKYSDYLN